MRLRSRYQFRVVCFSGVWYPQVRQRRRFMLLLKRWAEWKTIPRDNALTPSATPIAEIHRLHQEHYGHATSESATAEIERFLDPPGEQFEAVIPVDVVSPRRFLPGRKRA